jgi:hypothetical protein
MERGRNGEREKWREGMERGETERGMDGCALEI